LSAARRTHVPDGIRRLCQWIALWRRRRRRRRGSGMGLGSRHIGRVCRAGRSGSLRRVCVRRSDWRGGGGRLTCWGRGRGRLAEWGRGSLGGCAGRRLPQGSCRRSPGALVGLDACRLGRRGGGRRCDRSRCVSRGRHALAGPAGRGTTCRGARRTSRRWLARESAPSARVMTRRRFLGLAPLRAWPGALGGDIDTRAAVRAQSSSTALKRLDVQFLPTSRTIESNAHFTAPTDVSSFGQSPRPGRLSHGPGAALLIFDA